jgi:sulfur relay (sulfurtransferase) DsrC/TusE family protein
MNKQDLKKLLNSFIINQNNEKELTLISTNVIQFIKDYFNNYEINEEYDNYID